MPSAKKMGSLAFRHDSSSQSIQRSRMRLSSDAKRCQADMPYPVLQARVARECRASREAKAMTAALKGA